MKYTHSKKVVERYAFAVDTTGMHGDHSEMIAYLLGGPCQRWLQSHVLPADESVCLSTPGWFSDGYGHHYCEGTTPARHRCADGVRPHFEHLIAEAEENAKKAPNKKARTAHQRDAALCREDLANVKPAHLPAYLSVHLWLNQPPPARVVKGLKARAMEYAGTAGIVISRFRILKHMTLTRWLLV